jgi:hypothetical protein
MDTTMLRIREPFPSTHAAFARAFMEAMSNIAMVLAFATASAYLINTHPLIFGMKFLVIVPIVAAQLIATIGSVYASDLFVDALIVRFPSYAEKPRFFLFAILCGCAISAIPQAIQWGTVFGTKMP